MPLSQTLQDAFPGPTLDGVKWPDSYGDPTIVGGRGRVPCGTGYAAISSGLVYTVDESYILCQSFPAALSGATTECWTQLLIKSGTEGTDVIMEMRATDGQLVMASRVGYTDGAAVNVAYNATDHAWWRIRESGGNLYWDTSVNGYEWTNRRTLVGSPAWLALTTLNIQYTCHRSDGVANYAEVDNVNLPPAAPAGFTGFGIPI